MRCGLSFLIALMLIGCFTSAATPCLAAGLEDAHCILVPSPRASVDITVKGPIENWSQSFKALAHVDNGGKGSADRRNGVAFGFTWSEIAFEVAPFNGTLMQTADGMSCMWATSVPVKVSWTIHVDFASEMRHDGCVEKAVQAHEAKHVALDRSLAAMLKTRIETALAHQARFSILATTPAVGQQKLQSDLAQLVEVTIQSFLTERNRKQAEIDSTQEYARVTGLCGRKTFDALIHG